MFELTDVTIRSLRWSPWNVQHIARPGHDVTMQEVEEVVRNSRSLARMGTHGRLFVLGPTSADRILAVVLDPEPNDVWYCVSARTANAKTERPAYLSEYKRKHPNE